MLIGDLLNRLDKVKRQSDGSYLACCPAHPDHIPSLHITQAKEDNRLLLKCQAGCETSAIVSILNLEMTDLFAEEKRGFAPLKTITATYDYQDEAGNFLFQVVRYEPKSFAQRHKNGSGEWVWDTKGIRKVLYHLPEILIETGTIYLVEGEKDADKLWEYGQVATTSPGGANAWQVDYAQYLRGKRVVIIPDKDVAGTAYAQMVANSLKGIAKDIRYIALPGDEVKDISDWLNNDNDIADLPSLEQDISTLFAGQTPHYQRENSAIIWQTNGWTFKAENIKDERTGVHARISILQEYQLLAWSIINTEKSEERIRLANQAKKNDDMVRQSLDHFCNGLWDFWVGTDTAELMIGEDIMPPSFYLHPYILKGGGTILFAPPGRGKSYSALLWAQSVNTGTSLLWQVEKQIVLYINLERSRQSLKRRLASVNRVLGLPDNTPLLTFNRRGQPLSGIAPAITKAIKEYNVKLIILDSISRAGYGDLTENRPVNLIIDTLSNLCDSWVAIGHSPRADDSHIYGAVMFDAGADIIVQLSSEVEAQKLGIRYEITKSNDLPPTKAETISLEFQGWSLSSVKQAEDYEFTELTMKHKVKMLPAVLDFILNQDSADATATEIADSLSFNRQNISELLNKSGRFVKTKKVGRNQFYGVKE